MCRDHTIVAVLPSLTDRQTIGPHRYDSVERINGWLYGGSIATWVKDMAVKKLGNATLLLAAIMTFAGQTAVADGSCATADQARLIGDFYSDNPGTLPVMAARRLKFSAALVSSGLGEDQAVSAPPSAFAEIWAAMGSWEQANFLIMQGQNVFEIMSGVASGAPSTRSDYFNLKYEHPLRGHLRPDLYGSIYAVALPGAEEVVTRGVMFFDAGGELVFGVFMSGEALRPSPGEIEKFDAVMELVRSLPSVCPVPD